MIQYTSAKDNPLQAHLPVHTLFLHQLCEQFYVCGTILGFSARIDRVESAGAAVSGSLGDIALVQCVLGFGDDRWIGDVWK